MTFASQMLFDILKKQALRLCLLLELYAALSNCSPVLPGEVINSPHPISRRINIENLDLLVPDGYGNLTRATTAQRRDLLQKRQEPGQVTFTGSGQCAGAKAVNDISHPACVLFCNTQTSVVTGDAQTVSADVDCTVSTCPTAYAFSTTITESYSIEAGISAEYGKAGITGQATLGYSHTWSTAVQSTNTYTFTPTNGDKGHIVFVPYMEEACGTTTVFENSNEYYECLDWTKHRDGVNQNHVLQYDPMSCGQNPMKLPDNSANGVFSFCNTNTGSGCP